MSVRIEEVVDADRGRNLVRFIYTDELPGGAQVIIETIGNHDGVPVSTAVHVARAELAMRLKRMGWL